MKGYRTEFYRLLVTIAGLGLEWSPGTAMASPDLDLSYSSFAGENGAAFQMSGDATVDGSRLRLTREVTEIAGSAMHAEQVELAKDLSFSAYFTFRMIHSPDSTTPPADGIALVLHNHPASLGAKGHGIGYKGIDRSIAIELDIFFNLEDGDPTDNHVGITLNGDKSSLATAVIAHSLHDGSLQHAWVEYDGSAKKLEIRVAKTAERPKESNLSHPVDLSGVLDTHTMVGFTAGTGSYSAEHSIESLYFIGKYLRDGIEPPEDDAV